MAVGDDDVYKLVRGTCVLMRGFRREFQWQHKKIRSTPDACEACMAWSLGHGRLAIEEAIATLRSGEAFVETGMQIPGNFLVQLELGLEFDSDHPLVSMDNVFAGKMAELTLQLAKQRLRLLYWYEKGYPGRLAAMLDSAATAAQVQLRMKEDWALWRFVQDLAGATWRRTRDRSVFHLVVVRKVRR